MRRAIIALAACLLLGGPGHAQEGPIGGADAPRLYVIYEPLVSPSDLPIMQRLRPELVCRGWFKWRDARDYQRDAWIIDRCHALGVRVQGGVTVAALYPGENGISEEQFLDYATRGPRGDLVPIVDWYHVALHNPELREYIKGFVRQQIDAGVDGIWFDEIEGIYGWEHEGYDDYAIDAFADYLGRKYIDGRGWDEDDPRFGTELGIDLTRYGPTIWDFDYRQWLGQETDAEGQSLADDPWQGPWERPWLSDNPLYREWGHAWRPDPRAQATFQGESVLGFWREFVEYAREYARETTGRELVITCNENRTPRPYVDFQQPHDPQLPRTTPEGDLDPTHWGLLWLEDRVRLAEEVTPGAPVVQFVDWPGETDRLNSLPPQQIGTFLHTYVPEAYAAGALFALPVRGYSYSAKDRGMLRDTALLADHLRRYDSLLFDATEPSPDSVDTGGGEDIVARVRQRSDRTVVHLIDHRPLRQREPVRLWVGWRGHRGYVWTVGTRSPFERPLAMDGTGALVVPGFQNNALVVIEREEPDLRGRVLDVDGEPIEDAVITWSDGASDPRPLPPGSARRMEARGRPAVVRSAVTDAEGRWALAGLPPAMLHVQAEGHEPATTAGGDVVLKPVEGRSIILFVTDHLECLVPGQVVWVSAGEGLQATVTDAFGAARLTLPESGEASASAVDPVFLTRASADLSGALAGDSVMLRLPPPDLWIGDFEMGPLWQPNDSGRAAGDEPAVAVARVPDGPHGEDSTCMEVRFAGLPGGGWANAYSEPVDLSPYDVIRFWYSGDPSAASAAITLHCLDAEGGERFLRSDLPLSDPGWREVVIGLDEFTDADGRPQPGDLRRVSVQVSDSSEAPMEAWTVRLWGLRAHRDAD
jgi:hypothetical protein